MDATWHCRRLRKIAQLRSMHDAIMAAAIRYSRGVTRSTPGHSNGTAHHATTHPRPRRLHPGRRPARGCERAIPAAAKSAAEFCASAANHQSFARPNTGTLGGAFASADHQRTNLGSAFRGARGTRRAAFGFRIVPGAFRLPIAVVGFHIKGGCSAKRRLISWLEPARIPLERQVHGQLAIVKAATVARALSM
jgi:hypothetical protein